MEKLPSSVNVYLLHCESPSGDALLKETYETLKASTHPVEIAVVENGCITHYGNRLHIPTNVGVSKGYNAGLKHFMDGDGEFAILANNDISVDRGCVAELVRVAEETPDAGIVAPRIYYYGTNKVWYDGGLFNPWTGVSRHKNIRKIGPADSKVKETDWSTGCFMLIKRECIERVGCLDESMSPAYGEDLEYSQRVKRMGWKVLVNPRAKVYHKISQSIGILT